ncbi:hypothetical protein SAMN02744133_11087 [Thalassospira xiamenensis M-5 = DSM 17429]|uniref:Uncharacterized protein n=1 Tax=Thalassospira xiamenensis M-5 = DSM 17429 TaxID=1123366 RepID=A0AB72UA08_9PROT|nr:hypothetical protein [Thalassospira xiamenensis]AJD50993.1 hypothetical protein TH3_04355 [Thalassospira xiamenensis M-5 = DSM 17429]SIT25223.1 hypothetical protein SAMN02744133_11087 [Thalassospira xiamenensis M-5 = DSM 17429]
MNFRLSCFLSFVEDAPGFLVPIFSANSSNGYYSHFLNEKGVITSFFQIEGSKYNLSQVPISEIWKETGDYGIFCFRTVSGDLVYGSYAEVCEKLKEVDFAEHGEPISNSEVFSFLGDVENRDKSIDEVKDIIGSGEMADFWVGQEKKIGINGLKLETIPKNSAEEEKGLSTSDRYDFLWNNPRARNWMTLWLELWSEGFNPEGMSALGVWWLRLGRFSEGVVPIYKELFGYAPAFEKTLLCAMEWFAENDTNAIGWIRMWLTVWFFCPQDRSEREELEVYGSKFLMSSVRSGGKIRNIAGWVSVWKKLTRNSDLVDKDLCEVAFVEGQRYGKNKFYWNGVLLPLLKKSRTDAGVNEVMLDFLKSVEAKSIWCHIVEQLISLGIDRDRFDATFFNLLVQAPVAKSKWKQVWEILNRARSKSDLLIHTTEVALDAGIVPNESVPSVLIRMEGSAQFSRQKLAHHASEWLSNNELEDDFDYFRQPMIAIASLK